MQTSYMDFSKEIEILEEKFSLINELNILDENAVVDKLKNWSGEKIKSFVDKNYKKIEEKEKEVKQILIKNKVDVKKLQSEFKSLESQIKKDVKEIDKKSSFKELVQKIWDKVKSIKLFGNEGDPAKLIPALSMFTFISIVKILAFVFIWNFMGEGAVFPIKLVLVFIAMPVISEIGKFLAIKTGSYEKFNVYLNIAEFITMSGFYIFLTNVGLLPLLLMRGLQFVTNVGTGELIKKFDKEKGAGMLGVGVSAFVQLVRVLIEICFLSVWTGNPFDMNPEYTDFWKR